MIRETSDDGRPVVASSPDSPQAQAFLGVAEKVRVALFEGAAPRAAPRILMS